MTDHKDHEDHPVDEVAARAFRDDISSQLDHVQHGGRRKLIHRFGKPAAYVVPVALMTDVDAYLRTERGLSHVSIVQGGPEGKTTTLTRDELAARLRDRGDSLHLGDDETCLRTADLDVLSTLLGELAASRTDSLAELAGDWSARLGEMVADAQDRVG